MDPNTGPPPGLPRPKTSAAANTSPSSTSNPPLPFSPRSSPPSVAAPIPQHTSAAPWAFSLAAGLFPPAPAIFPSIPMAPQGFLPFDGAVQPAGHLCNPLLDNCLITDLAGAFPAPSPSDPWHKAHTRACAHAAAACAACSISLTCCSCHSLRFSPGPPPASPPAPSPRGRRSHSASPALFRHDVGNGTPPPGFDSHSDDHDDDAYAQALIDADTCDNSSCPGGPDTPARYTIVVEAFDDGAEEFFDREYRACAACNRACKKSFLGCRIKSRRFDNSVKDVAAVDSCPARALDSVSRASESDSPTTKKTSPIPGSALYAQEHPTNTATSIGLNTVVADEPLGSVQRLQGALHTLAARPPMPAAFVATIRVRHSHSVSACATCSRGLVCCNCSRMFAPAVARHLACTQCKHVAFTCCGSLSCCQCDKPWMPSDSILPPSPPLSPSHAVPQWRGVEHRHHLQP